MVIGRWSLVPQHREVALVLAHDRDEHILRQVQVLLLEAPAHRHRLLHQVHHLVQQARVVGDDPADFSRRPPRLVQNHLAPLRRVQHNARRPHHLPVVLGLGDGQLGRALRPQPARRRPRLVARVLERHDGPPVQRHQPAHRPREGHIGLVPAHGLAKADTGNQLGQRLAQHLARRAAGLRLDHRRVALALALPHLHRLRRHALRPRKARQRRRRLAVLERHLRRRAKHLHLAVRLAGRQTLDAHGDAAGRPQHVEAGVVQAGLTQQLGESGP